jgi:hypothetical protein
MPQTLRGPARRRVADARRAHPLPPTLSRPPGPAWRAPLLTQRPPLGLISFLRQISSRRAAGLHCLLQHPPNPPAACAARQPGGANLSPSPKAGEPPARASPPVAFPPPAPRGLRLGKAGARGLAPPRARALPGAGRRSRRAAELQRPQHLPACRHSVPTVHPPPASNPILAPPRHAPHRLPALLALAAPPAKGAPTTLQCMPSCGGFPPPVASVRARAPRLALPRRGHARAPAQARLDHAHLLDNGLPNQWHTPAARPGLGLSGVGNRPRPAALPRRLGPQLPGPARPAPQDLPLCKLD